MVTTNNNNIIYIAGFPRSGTTWFANLLNSHSGTIYRHELLGRRSSIFGTELYQTMKHGLDMSEAQYSQMMEKIRQADIETDKPPFFSKKCGMHKYQNFHYYAWLSTKAFPNLFGGLYDKLFRISPESDSKILMKETTTSEHLEAFTKCLHPLATLILVRNPLGAISSHIKGIKKGSMNPANENTKAKWIQQQIERSAEFANEFADLDPTTLSEAEYLAIRWRCYHEIILDGCARNLNFTICFYDDLLNDTSAKAQILFNSLGLAWEQQVEDFINESRGLKKSIKTQIDTLDKYYSVYRDESFNNASWDDILDKKEIDIIEKHTAPIMQKLITLSQKDRK